MDLYTREGGKLVHETNGGIRSKQRTWERRSFVFYTAPNLLNRLARNTISANLQQESQCVVHLAYKTPVLARPLRSVRTWESNQVRTTHTHKFDSY